MSDRFIESIGFNTNNVISSLGKCAHNKDKVVLIEENIKLAERLKLKLPDLVKHYDTYIEHLDQASRGSSYMNEVIDIVDNDNDFSEEEKAELIAESTQYGRIDPKVEQEYQDKDFIEQSDRFRTIFLDSIRNEELKGIALIAERIKNVPFYTLVNIITREVERYLAELQGLRVRVEKSDLRELHNLSEGNSPKSTNDNVLKRFERGELKKKCHQFAIEFNFQKGVTLTQEQITKVCNALENKGYQVNRSSVKSTLGEKLGYCERKKYK
jgi:hypothetical protein